MKKNKRVDIRLDSFEWRLIKIKADEAGLTISQYVRGCAMNREIKIRKNEEEIEAYLLLQKYHDNFRRIKNLFKEKNYPVLVQELENTMKEIKSHLKSIEK